MSKVTFSKGKTINLGNYESLRLDISIELECDAGTEDVTLIQAKAFVNAELAKAEQDSNH